MRGGVWATLIVLANAMQTTAVCGQDREREKLRVEGRIVDDKDQAILAADIFWSLREPYYLDDPPRESSVHALTDEAGHFTLEAPDSFRGPDGRGRIGRLWVVATGHAMEVVSANEFRERPQNEQMSTLKLSAPAPFVLRVVDPEKRAMEGALVEPTQYVVRDEELAGGAQRLSVTIPRPVRDRLAGITGENGEWQVAWLKRGGDVGFRVVSEKYGIQDEAGTQARGTVPAVTFRLRPTARIEGSTFGENTKAFAGLRLLITSFDPDRPDNNPAEVILGASRAIVVVGDDGRFEVPAIGAGQLQIIADRSPRASERYSPLDAPVISAPADVAAGTTVRVTLSPEATTVFRGVVVTEGTNEPVPNAAVTLSARKRRIQFTTQANARGEYSLTSVAADSLLTASTGIVQSRDVVRVRSSPGLKEVTCPPIQLPPTRKIAGRVSDASGQPVTHAEVIGLEVAIHHGRGITASDGRFEMLTAAERTITEYLVKLNGESRPVTIRSRDPLELVLQEAAEKP